MEIIRIKKSKNFTVVSNVIFSDNRISLKARGLYATVMTLNENEWDFSISGIVSILKEGKTSVTSAINELIEYNYCKREYIHNGKYRTGVEYIFYEIPFGEEKEESNDDENEELKSENLKSENLTLGNQPQLNTNLIKYLIEYLYKGKNKKLLDLYLNKLDMLCKDNDFNEYLEAYRSLDINKIISEIIHERIILNEKPKDIAIKKHIYHKLKKDLKNYKESNITPKSYINVV